MDSFFDALGRLLPAQFEEIIFRLAIPAQYLSPPTVAQSVRALEVLRYVEQQRRVEDLRAAITRVGGSVRDATTTPAPETTTMPDLSTRTIHDDHRTGVVHLIREALALKGDAATESARKILARCFAEETTYAELPNLGERAITRAIDRVLPDANIPETRVDELIAAVRAITPNRRVCPTCGRLDLARAAGQWSPVTADYCPADRGVYARVAFPADVIAWTDGRTYPPGTTLDDDRLPITDAAILTWAEHSGAASLSAWTLRATQDAGVSLVEFAGYLLRTRTTTSPLATLDALVDPRRAQIAIDADAMFVLARRAKDAKTAPAAPPPAPPSEPIAPTGWRRYEGPQLRPFRLALIALYTSKQSVERVLYDAGLDLARFNLDGSMEDVWSSVILEANRSGRVDAILAVARREYPNNPALRALG